MGLSENVIRKCHIRKGISTPQAKNKKYQSVGIRSSVTRRERRSRVPRKYLYVAFAACVVQQLRPRYRLLDAVGGRLHSSTVCMALSGLRAAFVWLCKLQTIENHVLYHATIVSRCKGNAPTRSSSPSLCVVGVPRTDGRKNSNPPSKPDIV